MSRPDDCSLTAAQYAKVRAEAKRALTRAGALGRFPTPVADIMAAAKIEEVPEAVLSDAFIAGMRRKAGNALKRALRKVVGLFDAAARLVFIDRTLYAAKQTFVRLHETAHGWLAWQRDIYAVVEECDHTLDPDVADLFDREANVFAAEVLFQLDRFSEEARDHSFGILTPVQLCAKYGASIYAAVRQYVAKSPEICAVLVLDPPDFVEGDGFRASLRRAIAARRFAEQFGEIDWPEHFTPADRIGAILPLGARRMSGPHAIVLHDRNHDRRECVVEAFTQTHQIFVLILVVPSPNATQVLSPSSSDLGTAGRAQALRQQLLASLKAGSS